MAIQFQCTACGKPIEIDDEYAGKNIRCYYCRSTVTAPLVSMLEDSPESGWSRPVGGSIKADSEPASAPKTPARTGWDELSKYRKPGALLRANPAGTWGLVLAISAIVVLLVAGFLLAGISMTELESGKDPLSAIQQAMDKNPEKMAPIMAAEFAALGLALLAWVLSLIGLTRRGSAKKAAVVGFLISSLTLLCPCIGTFFQLGQIISSILPGGGVIKLFVM